MGRGLHCSAWRREGSWGILSLCLNTWYEKIECKGARLFSVMPGEKAGDCGLKLNPHEIQSEHNSPIHRHFYFEGGKHWHRWRREVGKSPSLQMVKTQLDVVLATCCSWCWFGKRVGLIEAHSQWSSLSFKVRLILQSMWQGFVM